MAGTKSHTRQQLAEEMRKLNAQINVSGGGGGGGGRGGGAGRRWRRHVERDGQRSAPAENFPAALKLAAEILKEPAYPQDEFDRIKTQRLKALELTPTEPTQLAGDRLSRHLSPFTKGTRSTPPTLEEQIPELQKVTLDQARKFHDQFYGANYGVFAVVGPVNAAEIQKTVGRSVRHVEHHEGLQAARHPVQEGGADQREDRNAGQGQRAVPRRGAVPVVAERSRLPGDPGGELPLRRADHVAHLRSHPQPRGPELRRQRAADRAGGRGRRHAVGNGEPESRRRARRSKPASSTS